MQDSAGIACFDYRYVKNLERNMNRGNDIMGAEEVTRLERLNQADVGCSLSQRCGLYPQVRSGARPCRY